MGAPLQVVTSQKENNHELCVLVDGLVDVSEYKACRRQRDATWREIAARMGTHASFGASAN
jgi:hypothetical protein